MGKTTGRKGFPKSALLCALIVMKCEGFSQITDLVDYLDNNHLIAYYCDFDIKKELPPYWTYDRFIRNIDNELLQELMRSHILKFADLGIIDTSFIALDSTPVSANTNHNNTKAFSKNKFSKANHPTCDKDCSLGVHTAPNQHNEKNFEYYWGYKNHVLVDCITGLPLYVLTTGADIYDGSVAIDVLKTTNSFISVKECTFIADKAYDIKKIYNTVKNVYEGECFIPLNKRNTKSQKLLHIGNPICDAGLAMVKDGKTKDKGHTRQKYCCP